ncbi:hypothetical protein LMG27177_05364 [Paraburkholderia fynbosensis]|uniref:Uncharacterized protein n=1 Tax=Paraburkholderia fynbosensis TaxID=1200993 RepID=A0A6J5GLI3_9BURK|nr:hypothetical protein LMG27177_05364 [Paraburkholderia fynbosensis]
MRSDRTAASRSGLRRNLSPTDGNGSEDSFVNDQTWRFTRQCLDNKKVICGSVLRQVK